MTYQIFATMSTFYVPLIAILVLYWRIFLTARNRLRRRLAEKAQVSVGQAKNGVAVNGHHISTAATIDPSNNKIKTVVVPPTTADDTEMNMKEKLMEEDSQNKTPSPPSSDSPSPNQGTPCKNGGVPMVRLNNSVSADSPLSNGVGPAGRKSLQQKVHAPHCQLATPKEFQRCGH